MVDFSAPNTREKRRGGARFSKWRRSAARPRIGASARAEQYPRHNLLVTASLFTSFSLELKGTAFEAMIEPKKDANNCSPLKGTRRICLERAKTGSNDR